MRCASPRRCRTRCYSLSHLHAAFSLFASLVDWESISPTPLFLSFPDNSFLFCYPLLLSFTCRLMSWESEAMPAQWCHYGSGSFSWTVLYWTHHPDSMIWPPNFSPCIPVREFEEREWKLSKNSGGNPHKSVVPHVTAHSPHVSLFSFYLTLTHAVAIHSHIHSH